MAALALSIATAFTPVGASAATEDPLIDYPTFKGAAQNLDRNGAADLITASGSKGKQRVLRLTPGGYQQAGSAWSTTKLDVGKSFESRFRAYLHHFKPGADGIAFVVQTQGRRALGGWGGGLGYRTIKPSLAVEFDTFQNSYDPSSNHLAVVLGGNSEQQATVAESPIPLFGKPFNARVVYDATATVLRVYIASLNEGSTEQLVLEHTIDLAAQVGRSAAWVGFTGATGEGLSKQDIYSWTVQGSGA
ncbi:MAG TPA: L-type lectin-domain containing protein [Actinoplanes sp.]|nr:L-type lectin-domain containing protein [Actinoplanes sp.]